MSKNLKAFIEKRNELIGKMEGITSKVETEVRAFTDEENTEYSKLDSEVRSLDETIKKLQEKRSTEIVEEAEKREEVNKLSIVKDLMDGKNIKLEERAASNTVSEGVNTNGNVAVGTQVVGQTWADSIIRKVEYTSPLYGLANKIVTSAPHNIVLQGNKIGKFVKTAELADYVAQTATFQTKTLGAVKYTNMFTISKELIEDSMYNIESELMAQTTESLAQTLDELMIKGDAAENVEGLEKLPASQEIVAGGVKKVSETDLLNMFYAIKERYRQNAVWILSDKTCRELAKLKDGFGQPLLTQSYNMSPVGSQTMLLGKPVIVNDFIPAIDGTTAEKCIYFGDYNKVMTVGIRRNFEMQKSTEFGFLNDSIAVKSSLRIDCKLIDTESMVYLKSKIA